MDFDKICTIFTMQEPYYGILLSAMDRFQTDKVDTIGVCRSGNVFRLGYNPKFMDGKDLDTTLQILKHECLHVAFNHFTLWDDQDPPEAEHKIRNMAADLEVNGYIDVSKMKDVRPLVASDFGWDEHLGTMEYYSRLKQMNKQQQKAQAKNPTLPCNGGLGGQSSQSGSGNNGKPKDSQGPQQSGGNQNQNNGNPSGQNGNQNGNQHDHELSDELEKASKNAFDDHTPWPSGMDEDSVENLKQAVDDLLVFAAEEVEKGRGTVPGEMQGKIKLIRERRKPKPITNWKRYFRRYIGNEFSDQIRKSRKRESKRFPDAAGNRHKRKSHILVAIDTSGSISMPEYREFFGQLQTMKDVTFHVVECDARIQFEYDFNGKIREDLHGGGGTSFQPPVDMYNRNRRKYEGIVYFTDGEAPIPKDTPKEMLWVISSQGDHNRARYRKNGASVVFIPNK